MRKVFAILLTALLLFYWSGYQLLFAYWQWQARQTIITQLDNGEYDESTLVSLKIPATQLAYYNETVEFSRVDGVIEIGGITYRYVKRRFFADTIELLCIPDGGELRMIEARNELAGWTDNFHFPPSKNRPGLNLQKTYSPAALHLVLRPFNPFIGHITDYAIPPTSPGHGQPAERPPDNGTILS